MACLEGPHKEVKADREIERERSWGMYLYLKSIGGVLWGSQAGIGFNSNQEKRVFISPPGVLSKGCISHTGARRRGRLLIDHFSDFKRFAQEEFHSHIFT